MTQSGSENDQIPSGEAGADPEADQRPLNWPGLERTPAEAQAAPADYRDPESAAAAWTGRLLAGAAGAGLVLVMLALRDASPL